jgi:hypothetical protein
MYNTGMKSIFMFILGLSVGYVIWHGDAASILAPESTSTTTNATATSSATTSPAEPAAPVASDPRIRLSEPAPGETVTSPLTVSGEARGSWFFEGDFPVILTNWDGLIIAETYATAEGEWMTEEFVPFTAEVEFESPYSAGDPSFMQNGSLILQRANPSGLPENDAAHEIRIRF